MFDFLPVILRTPLAFGIVLGVLVFIHELGHYLAARWCGVHVETFSIGFGSAVVSWTDRLGTVWKIAWLPLGGYVKLHGLERPEDVSEEVKASWQPGRTFHGKSLGRRATVIAAHAAPAGAREPRCLPPVAGAARGPVNPAARRSAARAAGATGAGRATVAARAVACSARARTVRRCDAAHRAHVS